MLVSPLANPAGWLWTHSDAADLPPALAGYFPGTEADSTGPGFAPGIFPPGIAGTGPATTLRFPFTGSAQHRSVSGAQWIWGSNGDLPRFPELRMRLPFGNPLIAMRFTSVFTPAAGAFPNENARRRDPVVLEGPNDAVITDFTILAAYPLRPGMDTLSVLRHLREAFHAAFPAGHADRLLATSWAAFVDPLDALPQRLRLLEPSGAPVSSATVTLNRAAGPLTFSLGAAHRGDLVAASGLDRTAFDTALSLDVSGGAAVSAAKPGTAFPDGMATVTPADSHIDRALLSQWFAPNGSAALPRFTRGNRVQPFINGPEYYADLFAELNALAAPGADTANGVFYVTGYSLNHDAPLVPESSGLMHRTVADVATALAEGGAEARFLALQFLQLQPGVLETVEISAEVAGVILSMASMAMAGMAEDGWDRANFIIHSQLIAWALILGAPTVGDLVEKLEPNRASMEALAAIPGVEAHLDPYIAGSRDNPLGPPPGTNTLIDGVQDLQERFGGFHQKIAIVRNDSGLHAYCGGIDLNPNRLDDRDHGIRHPYHDVHARVNGPAANDLALTFVERWQRDGRGPISLGAAGALPAIPAAGGDVVQVARTYFRPVAGGAGFPFAPAGERTILDTQLAAIASARRYIYIEEQYLTPPQEYTDALIAAAGRVSGPLIIIIPDLPDQPFGLARRQAFVEAMKTAWGDRFKIGVPRVRFSRAPTSVASATGRLCLTADVAEWDDAIKVGPMDRLPAFPFWLVVGNEVMRATRRESTTSPPPTPSPDPIQPGDVPDPPAPDPADPVNQVEIRVQRAGETRLFAADRGTERKSHKARAPVVCGVFPGVYVHAKTMLIDDVFASIGSANVNRRGYYSDGEANLFAIPESLTHGDNWIRELRTRLWAEALGVSDAYARVAFANPGAHMELWDRKFILGNRFSPFEAQPIYNELELKTALSTKSNVLDILQFSALTLGGVADAIAGADADILFDTIVDPSSWSAPP